MLNTLTIEHIRMFNEKPWQFNFAPLTVLCGTNGSGKTTLLKTLLLLKQSQEAAKSRRQYQGYLRFTGDHVDLGNYDSFVSFNKIEDDIAIALRYTDMMPKEIYIGLSNYANVDSKDIDDDWVEYDLEVKLIFKRSFGQSEVSKQKKKSKVCNEYKHISGILHKSFYTIYFKDKAILDWHLIGVEDGNEALNTREYSIHLPNKFFESVGGNKLFLTDNADEAEYLSLKVMLDGLFPNTLLAVWKDDKDSDSNTKGKYPLPPAINIVINNLIDSIENIHHIGPLRAPGKRYYLVNEQEIDLDNSGEFLPYILKNRKNITIFNCYPNDHWKCDEVKLIDAVNYWLYYFRTGEYTSKKMLREIEVNTKDAILVNFNLKNQKGSHSFSLADSGFGYSQVLPIIIKCLLAEIDEAILIEQPELHLNPSLQVRLAEFFVAMSVSLRQIVIETHSEHIVNAIRVLSAESAANDISDNANILFLHNNLGKLKVHELSIKPDGTVPNWPKEFFGEALTLTGRLLRAQKIKQQTIKEA